MFNSLLALATIAAQITIVILVILLVTKRGGLITRWVADRAVLLGFLVALAATALSLIYSDVIGFEPCKLCWIQRIFLYPQVIILGLALWKKDKSIIDYSLALSIFGAIVALYQYYGQMFNLAALTACGAGAVSCAQRFFVAFGYITIPLESLTAFLLLAVVMIVYKKLKTN